MSVESIETPEIVDTPVDAYPHKELEKMGFDSTLVTVLSAVEKNIVDEISKLTKSVEGIGWALNRLSMSAEARSILEPIHDDFVKSRSQAAKEPVDESTSNTVSAPSIPASRTVSRQPEQQVQVATTISRGTLFFGGAALLLVGFALGSNDRIAKHVDRFYNNTTSGIKALFEKVHTSMTKVNFREAEMIEIESAILKQFPEAICDTDSSSASIEFHIQQKRSDTPLDGLPTLHLPAETRNAILRLRAIDADNESPLGVVVEGLSKADAQWIRIAMYKIKLKELHPDEDVPGYARMEAVLLEELGEQLANQYKLGKIEIHSPEDQFGSAVCVIVSEPKPIDLLNREYNKGSTSPGLITIPIH